ncbi:rhamnulokinase [Microbacterium sp. zg.Y625]|uniref:rhamnulokinase n=1 Tax=Microbacterium jiangjiandongii TaxID=3049071 RepID=UPI00214A9329|nr:MULTISPECIES: rhamnulokinase family protein [unclassified Microbacterium]MCR2792291.1 rhamnulokinase [Microbacterium sp. zg.Y625]WIM25087.1 rhamnulokinase family protein [Microbacterium sp. zg-Y625]
MTPTAVAALDFGASSGRVIVGEVAPESLALRSFGRFANRPVQVRSRLHWDVLALFEGAITGLREAGREYPRLAAVAVDTWGVDYALLRGGRLLSNPVHYRDGRTASVVATVQSRMPAAQQYRVAGIQDMPINTIYQLAAEAEDGLLEVAESVLLVPDLFTYWLSGARFAERTMASTTGMLDARTRQWDRALVAASGTAPGLLPELVDPGTPLGALRPDVVRVTGLHNAVQVVAAGSHDTASAVVAVPLASERSAFVSCGTWGLVGVERPAPELGDAAREAGFTNEAGVDGKTLLMRNVMGLWILSEAVREWERRGEVIRLSELLAQAAEVTGAVPLIDVDDPEFLPPGDMPARIARWCLDRGIEPPHGIPAVARCIVESLAHAFAQAVRRAGEISGSPVDCVHIVGGGAQNALLCQRTADFSGLPVLAGPVEATALGSILVQARTVGVLHGTLADLRTLVRHTHDLVRYEPR